MADQAIQAWNDTFGKPHFDLPRGAPRPFSYTEDDRLGGGGFGSVYKITLARVPLALKLVYTPRLTERYLNEKRILELISKKPHHRHIVELIGSYTHRSGGKYTIGLVIWPVARRNLAEFLEDIDCLGDWIRGAAEGSHTESDEDMHDVAEILLDLLPSDSGDDTPSEDLEGRRLLYHKTLNRLCMSFVCLAEAVLWLHMEEIRHKDIKPAQVLLSRDGLWLTDFSWSTDFSELSNSATSGGDRISLKYHAPERQEGRSCARSEDTFTLGCVFLEMSYRLIADKVVHEKSTMPWKQEGWSFQANLIGHKWLEPFKNLTGRFPQLASLIEAMLSLRPADRPTMQQVTEILHTEPFTSQNSDDELGSFHAECCKGCATTSIRSGSVIPQNDINIQGAMANLSVSSQEDCPPPRLQAQPRPSRSPSSRTQTYQQPSIVTRQPLTLTRLPTQAVPESNEVLELWYCCQCHDGPYQTWQVQCQMCDHRTCSLCQ